MPAVVGERKVRVSDLDVDGWGGFAMGRRWWC